MYKRAGTVYSGTSKQWSMLPGRNLRRIITMNPERLEDAESLQRRFLLRMIEELDNHPALHRIVANDLVSRVSPAALHQFRLDACASC